MTAFPTSSSPSGTVLPRLAIARWNDNELIFFDHERRESWIIYPPRTSYSFARRVMAGGTLVESASGGRLAAYRRDARARDDRRRGLRRPRVGVQWPGGDPGGG
jgi:hypothetical protein